MITHIPFDIGIRCAHFLSMKGGVAKPENDIFVGIRGSKISEISHWSASHEIMQASKALALEFINADHHVVLPGLVNAHTHLAMTLFRGLEDDVPLHQWLFERILPLEGALVDSEFVRIGTELAALECIRFGVTTVCDMYFFTETIAEVLDRAGLRGLVSQVFTDYPLPEDRALGSDKPQLFKKFYENYGEHPRITPALGPHSPYTCSDDVFKQVAQLSREYSAPIHTHVSETAQEVKDSLKIYGKSQVQRLFELGILNERLIAAHCVHFEEGDFDGFNDFELMRDSGASIAHNPDSNLKLSSGIAPIVRFRKMGIPVAFGTDGAASNNDLSLFGAMDIGTKLQKLAASDNSAMTASDALCCATYEGARALKLQDRIGSLEVGKEADLILVDLNFPHLQPVHDVRSLLVYSAQGLEVETVIVAGKVLLRDREFTTLDSSRIQREADQVKVKIQDWLKNERT